MKPSDPNSTSLLFHTTVNRNGVESVIGISSTLSSREGHQRHQSRLKSPAVRSDLNQDCHALISGVGSNRVLRGPQIHVVGVALIIEFCDHNIPFLKVVL